MKRNIGTTISVFLCTLFLLSCSMKKYPINEYISEDIDVSFKTIFLYVSDYVEKNIGENYSLYQVNGQYSFDTMEFIEFVFTKRDERFNDVYFVKFYPERKQMNIKRQEEAQRLYGRDVEIDFEEWKIDIIDIPQLKGELNFVYDTIDFHTVYDNVIVVNFMNNDEIVHTIDFDVKSNKINSFERK